VDRHAFLERKIVFAEVMIIAVLVVSSAVVALNIRAAGISVSSVGKPY
jgi:hypothetical protein